MKNAISVYLPVHFILMLIRLRRAKPGERKAVFKKFVTGLLYSVAFATGFASSIPFGLCYMNSIFGALQPYHAKYLSFVFSFFILLESSSRWAEMSIWVLANWFESQVIEGTKNQVLPNIPHMNVKFKWLNLRKYLWPSLSELLV